jgi:FAD:protein FMN transferase
MKETRIIMGMPVTVEVVDNAASRENISGAIAAAFDYFTYIDQKFSTYKPDSEMMRINRGEIDERDWSDDMRIVLMLAEETKQRTGGFFDIRRPDGDDARRGATDSKPFYDPSGLVKGWAIWNAAGLLRDRGFKNFYVDAGGDIQTGGVNTAGNDGAGEPWLIGIKNPLKSPARGEPDEIIKVIYAPVAGIGVATSGTYIRGKHIYNPKTGAPPGEPDGGDEIVSLTVIGPNIYEADRFATAAFAMGAAGVQFIESLPKTAQLEAYMIDARGIATMTSGFKKMIKK